jgi:hypothetical protein
MVSGFATGIGPGPATATDETGQTLTFFVTVAGTTGGLSFSAAPSIDPLTGALSFTTAADANGTATIDVVLQDNGSSTSPNVNTSAVQEFTIAVAAVNDEQEIVVNFVRTVDRGSSITITNDYLITYDADDTAANLIYTVTTGPSHGTLLVNGVPVTQFSQQQINEGLVVYQNDGTANSADSFGFTVDDGKGTASAGTFNIAIRQSSGDFNRDLVVDAGDYVLWRKTAGTTVATPYAGADGNGDTTIDQADYTVWQSQFGDAIGVGGGASVEGLNINAGAGSVPADRAISGETGLAEPVAANGRVQAGFAIVGVGQGSNVTATGRMFFARVSVSEGTYRDSALLDWLSSRDWEEWKYVRGAEAAIDRAVAEMGKQDSCEALDFALAGTVEDSV